MNANGFFGRWLGALTEADTRLLARFRIAHGLALAVYVAITPMFGRLDAFFTDDGAITLDALRSVEPLHASLTAFRFVHTHDEAVFAFTVGTLLCLTYAAGAFTRISSLLAFGFVLSVHHRAPQAMSGAMLFMDDLFLPLLLLPLGRSTSIDAWFAARRGRASAPGRVRSFAMLLVNLQIFVVYFFNAIHKDGEFWRAGTAVHYVLVNTQFAWPIGVRFASGAPGWLVAAMTYGTLVAEMSIALAVISPFRIRGCRRFAAIAIPLLHLAFGALLNVGPFFLALAPVVFLLLAGAEGGESDRSTVSEPGSRVARGMRVAREATAVGLLAFFLALNRRDEGAFHFLFGEARFPEPFERAVTALAVGQKWSMFSSDPPREQHLLMPVVELEDGRVVDVRTRREPDFERVDGRELSVDFYWQLVDAEVGRSENVAFLDSVARYFARRPEVERWSGERRVREVGLHILSAKLPTPGAPESRELHSSVRFVKRMRPREETGTIIR